MGRRWIVGVLLALAWDSSALAAPPYAPTPQDTARAWADQYANLQAILTKMPVVNGDGGAQVHVVNSVNVVCTSGCTGGGGGGGAVYGPTAGGLPAANPGVVVAGTADGSNTGDVENWKVDASHFGHVVLEGSLPGFASTPTVNLGTLGGAATAANQPALNGDGGALAHVTNWPSTQPISGTVAVSNFPATQPISAASLPLPAGAATAANQSTEITDLGSIVTNTTGLATASAQTTGNNSLATIATNTTNAATTTNQTSQITQETAINTVLGTVTASPTQYTIGDRLKTINTTLGSPFQAGGSIGNTAFGISGTLPAFASTPTFNCGTGCYQATQPVSGTVAATQSGSWSVTANAGTNLNTSLLALDTSVNGILLGQGSATSSQNGPLVQGAVTTGAPSYTTGKTDPLSLTTAGALRTDASATTQPVSNAGTFAVQAAQTGTWTMQPGNTANTTPWLFTISQGGNSAAVTASNALKVDGSAVTQPISGTVTANAGTGTFNIQADASVNVAQVNGVTVLTGAGATGTGSQRFTVAQDTTTIAGSAPGTAGSPSTNVVSVQGVSGGTAVPISAASLPLPTGAATQTTLALLALAQGSTTSGQSGPLIQGAVTTSSPSYTTGQTSPFSLTLAGALRTDSSATTQPVSIASALSVNPGTAANWGIGATGSAPPANAVYNGISSGGNLVGAVGCNLHTYAHITSATDTLLVQGVSSQTVKVCGVQYHYSGSAAQSVYLENTASTNANCSSTKTQISALSTGNSSAPSSDGFYNAIWGGLTNTSGNGLCANSSGSGGVDVDLWYTQGS